MTLAVATLALFAQFPGGSANDLAKHLATETKQNVVIVQSAEAPFQALEYDPTDLTQLSRTFRAKLDLEMVAGVNLIFSDGKLPLPRMNVFRTGRSRDVEWKALESPSGPIDFSTSGDELLDPKSLEKTTFSRPVKVHWFFSEARVSVQAKGMSEEDFLTFIAKGVGGRLVKTPKEYKIDFDPTTIRARAIKTANVFRAERKALHRDEAEQEMLTIRPDMLIALLKEMSTGAIASAFATPNSIATFTIRPTSAPFRLLGAAIESMLRAINGESKVINSPMGEITLPLYPDAKQPIQATLSATFGTTVKFSAVDANGVRIPQIGFVFDSIEY